MNTFLFYLKLIFGCLIGIVLADIVLLFVSFCGVLGLINFIIRRTFFLIFHPIRFFKEEKKVDPSVLKTFKESFISGFTKGFNDIDNNMTLQ